MWSPSSKDSANLTGVFPTEALAGSRCPWGAHREDGHCSPCPSPCRKGMFGGPRPRHRSHMIYHHMIRHHTMAQQTLQACRPPTSLSATLVAPWFLLLLFGQQTPQRAFILHSLQSPQAAGGLGISYTWFQSCLCLL